MILVTGGNGMLGGYVVAELASKNIPYAAPSRQELNLNSTDSIASYLESQNWSRILHLAAETDVDLCERDMQHAYVVNTLATQQLAKFSGKQNIPMLFISTSAVFGGISKLSYCELDIPMPLSSYGNSKYMAEKYLTSLCQNHLIIRSSFMIGGGPTKDKKFISKLLPQLKENKPVSVVYDKIGSLTYAKDVAHFIVESISRDITGLVHFSSENSCSRYDVVSYIAKKINSKSEITKVGSQMFPASAPRSLSESLYTVSPHCVTRKSWENIIDDYLKEWI